MRVLLADDDVQVRSALRLLLGQVAGIDVVGEARDAEGLAVAVSATCPDVVLLDWELPGLMATRHFVECGGGERPRVVVLSSRPEARAAAEAAGVDVFVSKGDPPEVLLTALQAVSAGGRTCLGEGETVETAA